MSNESEALPKKTTELDALKTAEQFLCYEAPLLAKIFGIDIRIQPGKGWSTDLESGVVTADLNFFIEQGYTPDMAVFGVLHEVAAHLQEVVRHPDLTNDVIKFVKQGGAYSIFHNIFSDIAGNNQIHSVLPRMQEVSRLTYSEKLFPEEDYSKTIPRHLQFLYAIIRDEMIPESQTTVRPEVSEAIAILRNYEGMGDLIKYSTSPIKEGTKQSLSPQERFNIWLVFILPVYKKLLQQDIEDPLELERSKNPENSNSYNQQGSGESTENSDSSEATENKEKRPKNPDYADFYEEYKTTRHPEPDKRQHIHDQIPTKTAEQIMADKFEEQTGYPLSAKRGYDTIVREHLSAIKAMREAFMQIINNRVERARKLRGNHTDGAMLNPDTLAQTIADVLSSVSEPPAFLGYEDVKEKRELVGRTNYWFVVDTSGSMQGEPALQAGNALVVALEGLSAMERDIARKAQHEGVKIDLEIKTAVYTFDATAIEIKPLTSSLDDKTRLTALDKTLSAKGSMTNDYLALEAINQQIPQKSDRNQIIFVITDGESGAPSRTKGCIDKLRAKGVIVIGVAIGSQQAVDLYSPTSKLIVDPTDLPELLQQIIINEL